MWLPAVCQSTLLPTPCQPATGTKPTSPERCTIISAKWSLTKSSQRSPNYSHPVNFASSQTFAKTLAIDALLLLGVVSRNCMWITVCKMLHFLTSIAGGGLSGKVAIRQCKCCSLGGKEPLKTWPRQKNAHQITRIEGICKTSILWTPHSLSRCNISFPHLWSLLPAWICTTANSSIPN